MKKMIRMTGLILSVIMVLLTASAVFANDIINVTLNGSKIEFDQEPVMKNDRVLVPMRKLSESLGATVAYDEETETVLAVLGNDVIMLQIGSNVIYVNNETKEIDVPAQEINGRTLIPARAFSECFKCNVSWDDASQTVIITK